jgi:hypothetical protein
MNGPSLALDESGNLHAVWSTAGTVKEKPRFASKSESPFKVLYRRFDARTQKWDAPVSLATGTHPRVVVTPDGTPFVTWTDEGIKLAEITPGGAPVPLAVSNPERYSAYPSLALTSTGELLVSWQQREKDDSIQVYVARVTRKEKRG